MQGSEQGKKFCDFDRSLVKSQDIAILMMGQTAHCTIFPAKRLDIFLTENYYRLRSKKQTFFPKDNFSRQKTQYSKPTHFSIDQFSRQKTCIFVKFFSTPFKSANIYIPFDFERNRLSQTYFQTFVINKAIDDTIAGGSESYNFTFFSLLTGILRQSAK